MATDVQRALFLSTCYVDTLPMPSVTIFKTCLLMSVSSGLVSQVERIDPASIFSRTAHAVVAQHALRVAAEGEELLLVAPVRHCLRGGVSMSGLESGRRERRNRFSKACEDERRWGASKHPWLRRRGR